MICNFKKRLIILFFTISVCVALCALLFACDPTLPAQGSHTLTFIADGNVVATISGQEGDTYAAPAAPDKDDFDFVGWYDDLSFGADAEEAPATIPSSDATYYAKYVARVGYVKEYYLQKLNAQKTAASDEYELARSDRGTGSVGATVQLDALDVAFEGFIKKTNANDVLSVVLGEDSSQNVLRAYYDRATCLVNFDSNGGRGEMAAINYPYGAIVRNDFEGTFERDGYRLAGFSGAYSNGTAVPMTDFEIYGNVTFTAIWHKAYKNAADASDVIYFDGSLYYRLNEGRRESAETSASGVGYDQFIFASGTSDELVCRRYDGSNEFCVQGDEAGIYVRYDHAHMQYDLGALLALDGFGYATISEVRAGGATQVLESGYYSYNDDYDDYTIEILDMSDGSVVGVRYFALSEDKPDGLTAEEVTGTYVLQGGESGTFAEFSLRGGALMEDKVLQLFGYGYARVMGYSAEDDDFTRLISEGRYYGTENYSDFMGEWRYEPENGEGFRFFIMDVSDGDVSVYMAYDPALDVELTEADGQGTLTIGGYNGTEYAIGGTAEALSGAISFIGDRTLRFVPYDESGNAKGAMIFSVDWQSGTFTLNAEGFIVENGVLTGYEGASDVIVIPADVTSVADEALSYRNTGVNLVHITICDGVTSLGARAFENYYTLRTAVFEAAEPIDIDWSNDSDPFRWPAEGDFKIYVPHASLEAYRAAWSDCKYTITSVEEQLERPVFDVQDGVLVAYNNKDEAPSDVEIVIPSGVTAIADGVFARLTYIVSVDLGGVTSIGDGAFEGCAGLRSVTAASLESVGAGAFALCTALESIDLPSAKSVGAEAFSGCEALTLASLGAGIERIGSRAFGECATLEYPTLFMLELASGTALPVMADGVFYGVYGYRVSVATLADALRLYNAGGSWAAYAGRAYVRENEHSALAGEWVDVVSLTAVHIGGRLETQNEAFIYGISGEDVTLYYYYYSAYDGSASRETVNGKYKDGELRFAHDGADYVVVKPEGSYVFATSAGETLTLDLCTFTEGEKRNPDGTSGGYMGTLKAKFEGQDCDVTIAGGAIVAENLKIGGVTCYLTLRLRADGTFDYDKMQNGTLGPFTAEDGSRITVRFSGKATVCLEGCLMKWTNSAGNPIEVSPYSTTWYVTERSGSVYVMRLRNWQDNIYRVTVTIDEAAGTFVYDIELLETSTLLSGGSSRVRAMRDAQGNVTSLTLLVPDGEGGTKSLVARSFEQTADGVYLVETDDGMYEVSLDFDSGSCGVVFKG